ncbi:putative beta-carotene-binding protein [Vespa velutina]|uniref:putative beta-carotene-binding protein n=1 Tax=Vespa velutina TaxID=202808 RepID=UPI001FB1BEA7|nr:putative beta-carotene-binding protein [Vespa velutina]
MVSIHVFIEICFALILFRNVDSALPPYIKVCKKHDPNINECVMNSIENLREKLAEGIPELDTPAIEPLKLSQIRLLRGPTGARLDINLTDIQVNGPSTFKIRDLKVNTDDVIFTFKVSFEKLNFQGKYQIDATLLLLKLTGEGELVGNFTGYDSDIVLKAQKIYRDNKVYLHFEKMKLNIQIGGANLYLNNLFAGDPVLGPASNKIINANSALLIEEIKPVMESSLADLFTNVSNKIVKTFTYDELFPEN